MITSGYCGYWYSCCFTLAAGACVQQFVAHQARGSGEQLYTITPIQGRLQLIAERRGSTDIKGLRTCGSQREKEGRTSNTP